MHGPESWDAPQIIAPEKGLSTMLGTTQEAEVPENNKDNFKGLAQAWHAQPVGSTGGSHQSAVSTVHRLDRP